jgi:hypothetical protein
MLPCELQLRGGEDDLLPRRAGRAHSLLRLLAQLLEIELLGHARLLSVLPIVRRSGGKKLVADRSHRGGLGPFRGQGAAPAALRQS